MTPERIALRALSDRLMSDNVSDHVANNGAECDGARIRDYLGQLDVGFLPDDPSTSDLILMLVYMVNAGLDQGRVADARADAIMDLRSKLHAANNKNHLLTLEIDSYQHQQREEYDKREALDEELAAARARIAELTSILHL